MMCKFISPEGLFDDNSVSLYTSKFVVSGKTYMTAASGGVTARTVPHLLQLII